MKEHATEEHLNESILNEEILEDQKKNRIDHMTYLPGMEDPGSDVMDQVVEAIQKHMTMPAIRLLMCAGHWPMADPVTPKDFAGTPFPCCTSISGRDRTGCAARDQKALRQQR